MSLITGNGLQNQSEILKRNLLRINYQNPVTFQTFTEKNPFVFLQILHYSVIIYNVDFYKQLIDKGYELFSKNDQNFMQSVYKFLFAEYNYKPQITLEQFFSNQFLEKKLILCNNIIDIIYKSSTEKQKKPSKTQKEDKNKPSKTGSLSQLNENQYDEAVPQIKVVKEDIPIAGLAQKQNLYQQTYDSETFDEQPRQLNFIAQKPYKQEQTDLIESNSNNPNYLNNQKQPNQRIQQQVRNKQQSKCEYIGQRMEDIKQEIKSIPEEQKWVEKSKQSMEYSMDQIADKFTKIIPNNCVDDEYKEEQIQNKNYQQNKASEQAIQTQNKSMSKLDRPVTARELNEVMKLIMSLSQTMQDTIHKLDQYQTSTNSKFQNINAQMMLLDGEVKLLKAIENNK